MGLTNGVSFGDFDADGWIDLFSFRSGELWKNIGGVDWQLIANLNAQLPLATLRYGSSFGDYNNDGFPDLATEPRRIGPDSCFHLLKNLNGTGSFVDVGMDPLIINPPACFLDSETICWGDTDFDGNLDLFLPVYPPAWFGPGNSFYHNLGPTGSGGAYRFEEKSLVAGLDAPPSAPKPEGAQFADVDFDGDLDLYCNGHLYQNQSQPGQPRFAALSENRSGIGYSTIVDEGASFSDYDLDGDYDLFVVYNLYPPGVQVWENYGDGTFRSVEEGVVPRADLGLKLGLSIADWDNDGDYDFTTRNLFRRNLRIETSTARFELARPQIPISHLTSATPSWGDWDRDGDLDCALGNWNSEGHLYENTTIGPGTAEAERRSVRVCPVRDSDQVDQGLETEYGASVTLDRRGDPAGLIRRQFTASSAGYLNQNEYALLFALKPDAGPSNPAPGEEFDTRVDFVSDPAAGLQRVDRWVNPALGPLHLASLGGSEIKVYRSGRVRWGRLDITPSPIENPTLFVTGGGLALASAGVSLPPPSPASSADEYVGIAFDTVGSTGPIRVTEVLLDGQLDLARGAPPRGVLWDVTNSSMPVLRRSFSWRTSPRNRRSSFTVDLLLDPGRRYRLVARVREWRASPWNGAATQGPVQVHGGLHFADTDPVSGSNVVAASPDAANLYLAFRYREAQVGVWSNLGHGVAGSTGIPVLTAVGAPQPGNPIQFDLQGAPPSAAVLFAVGQRVSGLAIGPGALIPHPTLIVGMPATDPMGQLSVTGFWPPSVSPNTPFLLQALIPDSSSPHGFALSNALWILAP